jgi:hypothetical protein
LQNAVDKELDKSNFSSDSLSELFIVNELALRLFDAPVSSYLSCFFGDGLSLAGIFAAFLCSGSVIIFTAYLLVSGTIC